MDAKGAGLTAAVFAVVGVGVGLVAAVGAGWAETALATAATGETARFGPVFVAQSYLAVTATALIGAPLVAGVLGVLFGSRAYDAREAAATSGVGGGVGALIYGFVVVALVVVSQGEAATQAHGVGDALGPLLTTAVVAAVVGAATGAVGSVTG